VAGKRDESARSARGNLTARIVTLGPRLGRKRGFQACPLQSTREVYITGYVVSIRRPFASATKSPYSKRVAGSRIALRQPGSGSKSITGRPRSVEKSCALRVGGYAANQTKKHRRKNSPRTLACGQHRFLPCPSCPTTTARLQGSSLGWPPTQ